MKNWLRPTLTRRVIGALILAVGLLAAMVLVQDQLDLRHQMAVDPGVRQLARQLGAGLNELDDPQEAAKLMAGYSRYVNRQRHRSDLLPGDLLLQLYDRSGRLLYASAAADPIEHAGIGEQMLVGRRHWTYREDGARWSLRLAEPAMTSTNLLGFASWELGKQLLLAFPLMLLPLWIAVHSGLKPLRRLTRRIDGLDADRRLAPLGLDLRYAELRPLGRAFDTLLQRLRERLAREQAFVHDAAHELRTPLAVIAMQAHVLVHAKDPEARADASAAMLDAIARSAHLSQQLLDLAALDQAVAAAPEMLDVAQLTGVMLAQQSGLARQRRIALSLDAPEHVPLDLDRAAFQSILQNLLDNALRYVPAGGRIEVRLVNDVRDGLRLSVADDGPGIAVADRDRVFDRFWRGSGHDLPGSGLGLAITRQAAIRLGGVVSLGVGLDGRGAGFELRVPPATLGVS